MPHIRTKMLIDDLIGTITAWMRTNGITHDDYRHATEAVIASIKSGEESLLFDVFFEAVATDNANIGRPGSPEAVEGPFYVAGAPLLPNASPLPQRPDERGTPLLFHGHVRDVDGIPLASAEIDIWQADADGRYSNFAPDTPDWNLRGRVVSDADGYYAVATIMPPPYEIPKDGPTGQVLAGLDRHFFRPAHVHVKVTHPGCRGVTSQLYFENDPYLDSDVANAVRPDLVLALKKRVDRGGVRYWAEYDFTLASATATPAPGD